LYLSDVVVNVASTISALAMASKEALPVALSSPAVLPAALSSPTVMPQGMWQVPP